MGEDKHIRSIRYSSQFFVLYVSCVPSFLSPIRAQNQCDSGERFETEHKTDSQKTLAL